jgi:thiamine-phosphate pyrophosphorylase
MRRRHHLPPLWLFTDERMGEALVPALLRLPRGSGVVLRHYGAADREKLAEEVASIAKRRALVLVVAGDPALARRVGAAGTHMAAGGKRARRPLTASAHDRAQLVRARRAGARLVFLSPVFGTASHPGARAMGPVRFGLLARAARVPVAALGGMNRKRFAALRRLGASGWGAIDALTGRGAG